MWIVVSHETVKRLRVALWIICLGILFATLLISCKAVKIRKQHMQYEANDGTKGKMTYWVESPAVSNVPGICAQISQDDHGKWIGETHRVPKDRSKDDSSYYYFDSEKEAEAWGDRTCPN